MAQQTAGSEATSVTSTTPPTPNGWENIHMSTISPWNVMNINNRWQQPPPRSNISSNNCEDQDHMSNISTTTSFITNASNHSMDSSSAELSEEAAENNLWNHVLFDGGDLPNDHIDNGDNFVEMESSKALNPTDMFNPACDYLKKLDSTNWYFPNHSPSINPVGINIKQMNVSDNPTNLIEPERLTNLSDMVSTWSIAPPNPNMSHIKREMFPNSAYFPSYEPFNINTTTNGDMGYQLMGLNNSLIGINNNKYCSGSSVSDAPWSNNARSLSDLISFKGSQLSTSHSKKQGYATSSTKGSGRVSGTASDGKKKRSEENSETQLKKSKHDDQGSNASSIKLQAPKDKLGEREKITALQQIVSPFGKTDTASVLLEAINHIRILQEQVQLLSDPYLKTSPNKDMINSWGSSNLERKDNGETTVVDLRSRGLCLVPISFTPQIYRESSGPDYWPPTFRGSCLFR